jgi:Bacterial Ig domain
VIGDQITFSRIRVKLTDIPTTGTYRIVHPYGEEAIDEVAGAPRGIFFSDDAGIGLPGGPFDLLLKGRLGPFLLPSTTPGGPELPAVSAQNPTPDTDPAHFGGAFAPTRYPGTGKLYIADPARIGPVTGSALADFIACPNSDPCTVSNGGVLENHNVFRIEGPPGSNLGGPGVDFIETTDFTLAGRVFTDSIPGRVSVERASYERDSSSQKLDVFASAFPTAPGRIPTQATPQAVLPQLTFFDKACNSAVDANGNPVAPFSAPTGAAELQMFNSGSTFWGQTASTIPSAVCVKDSTSRDATGVLVPAFFPKSVTDDVTVDQATYDPSTGTLVVSAHSSEQSTPPVLTLTGFGKTPDTNLTNGSISIASLAAPPAAVHVHSSRGGDGDRPVTTKLGSAPVLPDTPVAANDSATFDEDSGPQVIDVLGNDSGLSAGTPVITLTAQPRLGTAVVDTASNKVRYTPNLNAFGNDSFSYQVAVGSSVSNSANVTITINPLNDPPVAASDTLAAVANLPATLNLLANDTDPDGASDLASAVILTQPVAAPGTIGTATVTGGAGGNVSFSATAAGTYSFTYQAKDTTGVTSNIATVTVNVAGNEQIPIALAEFRTGQLRLRINGTISPIQGQTVTIRWANGRDITSVVATVVSDATGAWAIDQRPATGIQDPRNSGATAVVVTGPGGGRQVLNITLRN